MDRKKKQQYQFLHFFNLSRELCNHFYGEILSVVAIACFCLVGMEGINLHFC